MAVAKGAGRMVSLVLFIIVALACGWLGVGLDSLLTDQPEGGTLGMALWLVLPVLTMLVLRTVDRDWAGMGIKPFFIRNLKWYLVSLAIYPIVTLLTVGLALLTHSANLADFELNAFAQLAVYAMAGSMVKNIFEEFAWRGYLTPRLIERGLADWLVYVLSGLVWALWHAAYYLVFLPDVYFESVSRSGMLLSGCLFLIASAIMYVEMYRLTGSVWPCVVMHSVHAGVPAALMGPGGAITFTGLGGFWLNPLTGAVAAALFLGIGLWLRAKRIRQEQGRGLFG
ncbi:CPBP family intramembrane glutamic endopeptidase [Paenibacillus ginsengarvi]|uniref:CPBP family intramembrane metalloprotease n=1 Tax=Paenibacillus ginsengarvi TaxID=400777 RepID=A0A3B0CH16_9BACL|nr:CPBP family intramembrane glutamic endopeptidase [Paenibacillus ginsengarvi]RKN83994.1 CPBP family intramembrane metalloprotease [Paenibacillus ginsengarvi]